MVKHDPTSLAKVFQSDISENIEDFTAWRRHYNKTYESEEEEQEEPTIQFTDDINSISELEIGTDECQAHIPPQTRLPKKMTDSGINEEQASRNNILQMSRSLNPSFTVNLLVKKENASASEERKPVIQSHRVSEYKPATSVGPKIPSDWSWNYQKNQRTQVRAFEFRVPPKSNIIRDTIGSYHKTRYITTSWNVFSNSIAYEEAHTTKGLIKLNEKVKKRLDSNRKPCKKNKLLTKRSNKKASAAWKPVMEKLS